MRYRELIRKFHNSLGDFSLTLILKDNESQIIEEWINSHQYPLVKQKMQDQVILYQVPTYEFNNKRHGKIWGDTPEIYIWGNFCEIIFENMR